ncbi:hypothetical protein, partial [Providencia stuartii]
GDNLAIGKTCFFHRNFLSSDYKKILLINTPIFRGDYQPCLKASCFQPLTFKAYYWQWAGIAAVRGIPHRIITLCFGALDTVAYNAGIQWLYQLEPSPYCSLSKGAIALYGHKSSRYTPSDFY